MALIGWTHGFGERPPALGQARRWLAAWTRFKAWLEAESRRRRLRREEAYLAQAADLYDLERRMHDLERQEERPRFIGYF
jgi:uncharacterized protein DUF3563